ncbi:MAG: DNA polymerase IV [Acidobacteria bacterium]|nr:MAG: DNA polymerase IV [Acidobacteriota bacterium]
MGRTILHVDMDAFYAAIEQRDRIQLRGKPVIVGADPKNGRGRGIVSTCSYEARRFGVHSAQPISKAWRLCPQGIYVRPDMAKYARVSERIMSLLMEFSDLVEQVSIDEAFLDVTGSRELYGSGEEIARKIKSRIYGDQRLTASVGVAGNKFVAKVASDLEKPDGLVIVPPGKEKEFLSPLPMTRLWGVGAKTATYFTKMGIERIGQLADTDRAKLVRTLGKGGEDLWRLSQGIDDRTVSPEEGYKSIGHETTFEKDTADPDVLHDTLLELTEKVAQRLRSHQVRARTIAVKFREADFTTYTRRTTLQVPADTAERIFPVAQRLMRPLVRKGKLVRLIGIYGSNLVEDQTGQLPLFGPERSKDRDLAAAMDDITGRFGDSAITRASLVPPASKRGKT